MKFSAEAKGTVRIIPLLKDQVPQGLEELYSFLTEKELFKGAKGELYADLGLKGTNTVLVGLGDETKVDSDLLKTVFYKLGKLLAKEKVASATVVLSKYSDLCYRRTAMAISEGLANSAYHFNKYLTGDQTKSTLEEIGFEIMPGKEAKITEGLAEITNLVSGVELARNLVNEPADVIYPQTLAKAAVEALEPLGVEVSVMGLEEIQALGMTAFLAVARGSAKEPKLIVMRYRGGKSDDAVIGLVGKGLTYDSGGYALKPAASMAGMFTDMGGAGSVIGTMAALAANHVEKNVTAVVAACENMISGDAYRNGDIIYTMAGKTVEVGNTDAEGRLTLADAIYYMATKENAQQIIDVATLTGACVVALGSAYSGAVSNDQTMMDDLLKASKMGGEKIWQLPADDDYREMIKGKRADLLNSVKGGAGTITAGLFLEHFTDGKKWVHLDIAGTAYNETAKGFQPSGATGIPVKTLYFFCKGELENQHSNL